MSKKIPFLSVLLISFFLLQSRSFALTEKGFENLHIFSKVLSQVENNYVEEVDDHKMIQGAIRGLLMTLDPHTVYMPPEAYKELKVDTSGKFGGVGVEVWVKDGVLTVVTPIEGSPAEKSGLKPGDKILKIDGFSTKELDLGEAVLKMRGKVKSKLTLTVTREGVKNPFDVVMTRELINVPSVKYEVLDKEYGYIKLRTFQERSVNELGSALEKLEKQGALKGLILDLRNNPGGLLDQAVEVADLFLDKGVIVTTKSRGKEIDRREAHAEKTQAFYPMIILVNGGTASASEIVAGALKDHERAVVLGTKTFGKGSVQTVLELDDGSALKLTIALYFTPSGKSIQAYGVTPDIVVEDAPPEQKQSKKTLREEDLPGHLEVQETEAEKEKEAMRPNVTGIDYQKQVALDYLKSWGIFKARSQDENVE